jgi:ribose 5-phosphate isomerase B
MRIAIAADHVGYELKQILGRDLQALGHEVRDLGTHDPGQPDDYPDFAAALGQVLQAGQAERGVLICGSGVGAAVAANKLPGIRAGLCHDTYSAHQGVEHDDMNVLVLGARVIGPALAQELVGAFLRATFTGEERHRRRLAKVRALEQNPSRLSESETSQRGIEGHVSLTIPAPHAATGQTTRKEMEMVTRNATAEWHGNLETGQGNIKFGSGAYEGPYSFKARLGAGPGTNPEELIAAAHAGCFTMALSAQLSNAGHPPRRLHTTAKVQLDTVTGGFVISRINLETEAEVPGIEPAAFQQAAETAKKNCPVSKALAGPHIELKATLLPAK